MTFLTPPELKTTYYNEYTKIKNGIIITAPIQYFIKEGWHELYPSTQKAKLLGIGKFKLTDFLTEHEERNKLMRKIILENLDDDGITQSRV